MIYNSHNVEFGYELIAGLPYAYWLHVNGLLEKSISGIDTKCLYYFSDNHEEDTKERKWGNMVGARDEIPNMFIHKPELDELKWFPPPLKQVYKNNYFKFDKPILCICNRVNVEWGREAINYFDIDSLEQLFTLLSDKYQIIYFNIKGQTDLYDGIEPIDIRDYEYIQKNWKNKVLHIHDLAEDNKNISFNRLQLMIFANCEKFITMNGGYSILASYMGGTNIIYTKECKELSVNSFYKWYHKFGDSRIKQVDNYNDLYDMANQLYVQDLPEINILVRTHKRKELFKRCMNSIYNQTYKNWNIIVGSDDRLSDEYAGNVKGFLVKYNKQTHPSPIIDKDYGNPFSYNNYLNSLQSNVKNGFIMFLDDDDQFASNQSLSIIAESIVSRKVLVFWRVDINGKLIPSDNNFGKEPVVRDISGVGFMFHKDDIKHAYWEPYKRGDYRIAKKLYDNIKNRIYIYKTLVIGSQNMGNNNYEKTINDTKQPSIDKMWNEIDNKIYA